MNGCSEIAAKIDHTLLKADASRAEVDSIIGEALQYGFASVCVNPAFVRLVKERLAGSIVKACGVVGFPLGANSLEVKKFEAVQVVKDGADEIDFVGFLPNLIDCDYQAARDEFSAIVSAARAIRGDVVVKVIIESAALMDGVDESEAERRIEVACRAAADSGCDFVKTSTGFHPAGGASTQAIGLMKKYCGGLLVKASGGIRTYDDAVAMIAAGADRLGCSAGVEIVGGGSG